jgi:hypothetical protein
VKGPSGAGEKAHRVSIFAPFGAFDGNLDRFGPLGFLVQIRTLFKAGRPGSDEASDVFFDLAHRVARAEFKRGPLGSWENLTKAIRSGEFDPTSVPNWAIDGTSVYLMGDGGSQCLASFDFGPEATEESLEAAIRFVFPGVDRILRGVG